MKKIVLLGLFLAVPGNVVAQEIDLEGTWQAETPEGPQNIIIRSDSSASYGDETVRWRLESDSILIAFGDEWMVYGLEYFGSGLVMSGGDLEDPIEFHRVGPAQPLPDGIEIPSAPPADARGVL